LRQHARLFGLNSNMVGRDSTLRFEAILTSQPLGERSRSDPNLSTPEHRT